jgi:TPR repeat protein
MGDYHYYGQGVEKSYIKAADAYIQAEGENSPQAMFNLGYMYENGLGFDRVSQKRKNVCHDL